MAIEFNVHAVSFGFLVYSIEIPYLIDIFKIAPLMQLGCISLFQSKSPSIIKVGLSYVSDNSSDCLNISRLPLSIIDEIKSSAVFRSIQTLLEIT